MTSPEDDDDTDSDEAPEFGFRDPSDPFDPDEPFEPEPDLGPEPDDGGDELVNDLAVLEWTLDPPPGESGERSCIWCRELVIDDFDHDFCEPDEPTEKMPRPVWHRGAAPEPAPPPPRPEPEAAPLVWRDHLVCPDCKRWTPVELEAPERAVERHMLTATSVTCCAVTATVTYSWSRRAVVALRYSKKAEALN